MPPLHNSRRMASRMAFAKYLAMCVAKKFGGSCP